MILFEKYKWNVNENLKMIDVIVDKI